jgi:hypothetical protein
VASDTPPRTPAPSAAASARPAALAAAAPAQVMVYEERAYKWRPGDDWAKVSVLFFQSDRYARALEEHHRRLSAAGQGTTGELTPAAGEQIFVPSANELNERYGTGAPGDQAGER